MLVSNFFKGVFTMKETVHEMARAFTKGLIRGTCIGLLLNGGLMAIGGIVYFLTGISKNKD